MGGLIVGIVGFAFASSLIGAPTGMVIYKKSMGYGGLANSPKAICFLIGWLFSGLGIKVGNLVEVAITGKRQLFVDGSIWYAMTAAILGAWSMFAMFYNRNRTNGKR